MSITYFESWNLAILLLTFLGGLALANILRSRGVQGCLSYLISLVILVVVITGLVKGYSFILENVTFHLQQYIYYNGIGVLGFVIGLLAGLLIRKRS